jgi:hypothetical protein
MRGYFYLASPYTLYPYGLDAAYELAVRASADLAGVGISALSPIMLSHLIAQFGGLDPRDHALWMRFDRPFMLAARGIIVLKAEGWRESAGMAEEIRVFATAGKPRIDMEPGCPKDVLAEIVAETMCPAEVA